MRSNPHIYPSESFPKIKITSSNKFFLEKIIEWKDVLQEVKNIIHRDIVLIGKTTEEKIFSIFLDTEILFGPRKFLLDRKDFFVEKIKEFTKQAKPIQLTILSFPFKVEVPLKTNRIFPDMGDILQLYRLFYITQKISSLYNPGAIITIFTEEVFAPMANANEHNAQNYAAYLKDIIKNLSYEKNLKTISLSEVEKNNNFASTYKKNKNEIAESINNKKGAPYAVFCKTYPIVFRIVSINNISKSDLLDIYQSKKLTDLNKKQKLIYADMLKDAKNATMDYLAYIKTIEDLNFLKRKMGLYLPLTVSPKPGKVGIIPISKKARILSHHGVPVKNEKTGQWDIRYLCEVEYNKKKYAKVYLEGDKDSAPFYYLELKK